MTLKINNLCGFGKAAPAAGGPETPPSVVFSTAFSAGNAAITFNISGNVQENDILVAILGYASGQNFNISDFTTLDSLLCADYGIGLRVQWKRAGAAEANPVTNDPGSAFSGGMLVVRGCPTEGDPWDSFLLSHNTTNGNNGRIVPGITTTQPNSRIIHATRSWNSAGSGGTDMQGNYANGNLGAFTEHFGGLGSTNVLFGYSADFLAAGATGDTTYNRTGLDSSAIHSVEFMGALKGV